MTMWLLFLSLAGRPLTTYGNLRKPTNTPENNRVHSICVFTRIPAWLAISLPGSPSPTAGGQARMTAHRRHLEAALERLSLDCFSF